MHKPMGEVYLIQEIGGALDAHAVARLLHGSHNIHYHALIAIKSKCPLQHDGDSSHNITPERIVYVKPSKISFKRHQVSTAPALLPGMAGGLDITAFLASGYMEDHAPAYAGEGLHPTQDVHQDALPRSAPAQNAYRFALLYDQIYVTKSDNLTKPNRQIPNLNKRCQIIMPHKLIIM
jgi:hypothetical protein